MATRGNPTTAANASGVAAAPLEVRATSRYVRVAPNKARQVIEHIRGLGVEEARRTLLLSPKEVSGQILKTLDSAVANAEHNHDLSADDLVVATAFVDEGPTLKRFQPRAMGRAYRVRKRTSHITITVGAAPEGRRKAAADAEERRRRLLGRRRKGGEAQAGGRQDAGATATATQERKGRQAEAEDSTGGQAEAEDRKVDTGAPDATSAAEAEQLATDAATDTTAGTPEGGAEGNKE